MYDPWLKPVSKPSPNLAAHTFARHLRGPRGRPAKNQGPRARKIAVAIIGIDEATAEKTRTHLYRTSWAFGKLAVRDLGNLRKATPDFLIPLLRELAAAGITPLLIGSGADLFAAQYLAFAELNRQISLLQIDRTLALSPDGQAGRTLDNAVYAKGRHRYHLTHLGGQQHLIDPALLDYCQGQAYEVITLGPARSDLPALEPVLRDADLVGLDVAAINHHEAPARPGFFPSGFSLQEASQLAYYAGNSDKLSSFGLYGLDPTTDPTAVELTAAAYAQLAWYFLLGFSRRQGDFPVSSTGLTEYVVDLDAYDRLTFWRSPRSNRWWVQVPAGEQAGEERHRLVPCTYEDYLLASTKQALPDRLVMAFQRYG